MMENKHTARSAAWDFTQRWPSVCWPSASEGIFCSSAARRRPGGGRGSPDGSDCPGAGDPGGGPGGDRLPGGTDGGRAPRSRTRPGCWMTTPVVAAIPQVGGGALEGEVVAAFP